MGVHLCQGLILRETFSSKDLHRSVDDFESHGRDSELSGKTPRQVEESQLDCSDDLLIEAASTF